MDGQGDSQEVRASAFTSPAVSRSFSFHFILFLDASLFFQVFLHFPHAKCRTFFSSAAWQYAFQLGTWLGHRLLVAKDKEKKNYRRENLETTVS